MEINFNVDPIALSSPRCKWKDIIHNLLYDKSVCGFCLWESSYLKHLDTIYHTEYEKDHHTLESIIQFTFGRNVQNLLPTKLICENCITLILKSYLMILKLKTNHIVIQKYMNILSEQVKQSPNTESQEEKELVLTIDNVNSLNVPTTVSKIPKETNNVTQIFLCDVDTKNIVVWDKNSQDVLKYKCPYCNKKFAYHRSIINHRNKHKDEFYRCTNCTELFKGFKDLMRHRKVVHSERISTCDICRIILLNEDCEHKKGLICELCQISFNSKTELVNHNKKHLKSLHNFENTDCSECKDECIHKPYLNWFNAQQLANKITFQCLTCNVEHTTKDELITHVNEEHLQHSSYLCELCGQSFSSQLLLSKHIGCHETESVIKKTRVYIPIPLKTFECKLCGYCFFNEKFYRAHRRKHMSGENECQYCQRLFYNINRLNMHIAKDHKNENPNNMFYKCSMCTSDFDSRKEYLKHITTHPKDSKHICRVCKASCTSKRSYLLHVKSHKQTYDRECPVCFKMYTLQTIQRHMKTHLKENWKDGGGPKACDICGQLLLSDKGLIKHSKTHKEEQQCPYCHKCVKVIFFNEHLNTHSEKHRTIKQCQQCDYTTRFSPCLQAHVNRFHLKSRPFQCTVCNKTFYSEYTLKGHQVVHNDTRQEHFCEMCGKKFISTKALMLHMRLHTGETPYPCDLCKLSFLSSSRRRQHMIRKHFEPSIACDICHKKMYTQSDLKRHMTKCAGKETIVKILETGNTD